MNRHEGVSCDSCMKGNFRGRRYKCLVCYDYDLCGTCYEAGASTTRHLADHPMQCILTRQDFELYYGGEGVSVEQPQSLTCPYCTRMGFTETTLQEHVAADHPDTSFEVICPVCASLPGGEPNLVTDDIAGHLTLEHRSGPRDLITFLDDSASSRHGVRRINHAARGVSATRPRSSTGGLSPSNRDGIDPIAELLSQLSGVRRSGASSSGSGNASQSSSAPSQLQQLQMQLQLERQQVRAARQQLERLPKRQTQLMGSSTGTTSSNGSHSSTMPNTALNNTTSNNNGTSSVNPSGISASNSQNSTFLLPRCIASTLSDSQLQNIERESANRSLFTRELVVSTLVEALPELTVTQQQAALSVQTPISTAQSSPETPSSAAAGTTAAVCQAPAKKLAGAGSSSSSTSSSSSSSSEQQEGAGKRGQNCGAATVPTSKYSAVTAQQLQQSQTHSATTNQQQQQQQQAQSPSQGLPTANAQSAAPVVPTLMHVIPQPLVLQQPLPIRNTGTGTIREQMATPPANAYVRPGVGPVGVTTGPSRRKPVRTVDGRNQSTEPPPPH
ncbi:E3 ubiquitin-protein ligase KCMF1 isoform X2 [Copidosoma floridanum]|uniref:E3 ubiquitin-protein ligase KCMF1 isoform X2 n=1 Tax=Copidosoma floridanum TaxID=29053 RepID=UPI0006C966BB|nr:E3 ubiquitin-protein ligase KCMF1 isoform X2 [Copidosoma floridanum]